MDFWIYLRNFLCRISPRFKLHCICKVLHITPFAWQKEYALTSTPVLRVGMRANGKTTAVMLRALLYKDQEPVTIGDLCWQDPDFLGTHCATRRWFLDEYNKLRHECENAGLQINPIWVTLG